MLGPQTLESAGSPPQKEMSLLLLSAETGWQYGLDHWSHFKDNFRFLHILKSKIQTPFGGEVYPGSAYGICLLT